MAIWKDIELSQGEDTEIFFKYIDSYGNGIDLTGNNAVLAIKRYPASPKMMLLVTNTSVIHGGDFGEFTTEGYLGSGHSEVNVDLNDNSLTGGIVFNVNKTSMSYLPSGRHFYEVSTFTRGASGEISTVKRLIEGGVDIRQQFFSIPGLSIQATLLEEPTLSYYFGPTAPTGELTVGDRWWNTDLGAEFVYVPIEEGGEASWVQAAGGDT